MINVTVNTKEFDKVFKEYMKYSKRDFAEACNQHAYYIARDATLTTKKADKEQIRTELEGSSRDYPSAPLAAILVNAQLGKKGKKGLTGEKMARAVEKYIKKQMSHVNFLRSGWMPAIKRLALVVPKRGGSKIPPGTSKKGRDFGGASPAIDSTFSPLAVIWNSVQGSKIHGDKSAKVRDILEEGAKKAVEMEQASMVKYIVRKQNELIKRLWK